MPIISTQCLEGIITLAKQAQFRSATEFTVTFFHDAFGHSNQRTWSGATFKWGLQVFVATKTQHLHREDIIFQKPVGVMFELHIFQQGKQRWF